MEYFDFPKYKDYELTISYKKFFIKKELTAYFQEATIIETLEFMEKGKNGADIAMRFVEFLRKKGAKKHLIEAMKPALNQYMEYILPKVFPYVFAGKKEDKGDKEAEERVYPFSAVLVQIAKECGLDPLTFMERYTFAQMDWIREGLVFNANELTDEGKRMNDNKHNPLFQESDEELKARLKLLG